MKKLILALLLACNQPPSVVATEVVDGVDLGVCIISEILSGNTDPGAILGKCASRLPQADEKMIAESIDRFDTKTLAPAQVDLLARAKIQAVTKLASKAGGK